MQQKPYNKNKIGKLLGWGGEHLVFQYGEGRVIKFSLHTWLSGKSAVEKIIEDYKIGSKYLSKYLLPTEIKTWPKGSSRLRKGQDKRAVEFQEKINCRFLAKKDLNNPLIKKQFSDIIEQYKKMRQETGLTFDLFGREGLLKLNPSFISNILVTPEDKLVIADFTILKLNKTKIREIPIWLIIKWAKRRQKRLLCSFINYKK